MFSKKTERIFSNGSTNLIHKFISSFTPMHHDPNNPQNHDDKAKKAEDQEVQHLDKREQPGLQTPDQTQHKHKD